MESIREKSLVLPDDESVMEIADDASTLLSDLILFTQVFYKLRTGRDFKVSTPIGRESHYTVIARALNHVFSGQCNKLIINVPPRYGKAIDIDTPMLTRNGWKPAKDIRIDDELVGTCGWTKVTGVFYQGMLPAKEVFFNDNQSVVCNAEHLWNVCDRYTPKFKTFATQYIENTLYEADGRKHWRIPIINGEYGDVEPFIDPYLFGCWLGDGTSSTAAITTMDDDIVKAFIENGHLMKDTLSKRCGKAKTFRINKNGFQSLLRKHNLLKNKHIPDEVYRWSKSDRLSLLQGLMDTDGTCNKKNGQVSFCNKNKNIINGFCYLVNSLGGVYRIYHIKSGSDNVNIRLPNNVAPFRLQRKQKLVPVGIKCYPRRFISAIVGIEPCEMVCFSVDSKDRLFAVGKGLILTHNTSLLMNFVAWTLAHYSDSNYLYISVSHDLATRATSEIRNIITTPYYRKIFDVNLRDDSSAKGSFTTKYGGTIEAIGAGGTIVGKGAGLRGTDRFGGSIIIDDVHKPDEATSDVIRNGVIEWFHNTLLSRRNDGERTPIIYIGQRVHEMDLAAHLIEQGGWKLVSLPALDFSGNALCPELHTAQELRKMQKLNEYVFAAQFQQDPAPAGGGLFKIDNFPILEETPKIIKTFITVDCAETAKTYNDATVFSLWGIYKIERFGSDTGLYGLHWLNCIEIFVEPKDLKNEFMEFYASSNKFNMLPSFIAIEKKSTGTTLVSVLNEIQGLSVIAIDRTIKSGSKTDRFISMQSYIAQKLVTLPYGAKHTKMCIDHMAKITANGTERRDDIADTLYDAVRMAFIDKTAISFVVNTVHRQDVAKNILKLQGINNNNKSERWS